MRRDGTRVYLYDEPRSKSLDVEELKKFCAEMTGLDVAARPEAVGYLLGPGPEQRALEEVGRALASAKVRNLTKPDHRALLQGEIDYEMSRLANPRSTTFGILYDGFNLLRLFWSLLDRAGEDLDSIHIIFTNQLIGTWDGGDGRYHARTGVYGFPSIISTSGLVEAPAKPRPYYWLKQQVLGMGLNAQTLEDFRKEHQDEVLDFEDARLTDVIKGCVLQAVHTHFTGEAFCSDQNCRLFNAHWQKDLIRAQLNGDYELCAAHTQFFDDMRKHE